jgi:transposase
MAAHRCAEDQLGKRTATVRSLVQSARMHGHDPWMYLRAILSRLPTHPAREIGALLPHRWTPRQQG